MSFFSKGTQVIAEEVPGKWFFVEKGTRFHGFYLGIPYKGWKPKGFRYRETIDVIGNFSTN